MARLAADGKGRDGGDNEGSDDGSRAASARTALGVPGSLEAPGHGLISGRPSSMLFGGKRKTLLNREFGRFPN